MTVRESINNAMSENDIKGIRIMMKNSLLVDPSFAEFNEMEEIAGNMIGLYDEHDGRGFDDKSLWNDDYMNKLMVQVVGNFSHERLGHLKEVVRYLRPVVAHPQQSASTMRTDSSQSRSWPSQHKETDYQKQKHQDERERRILKIVGSSAAGAVAGGIVAKIVGGPIVIGVVIGAAVVGAVAALTTRGVNE